MSAPGDLLRLDPPRLVGGYSPASGLYHFPLQEQCPYSGATDVETVDLSTRATVWGCTEVTSAPPGYHGPVPYCFGVVELPEGLRLVTRLAGALADLTVGQAVELRVVELATDDPDELLTIWEFAPIGTGP